MDSYVVRKVGISANLFWLLYSTALVILAVASSHALEHDTYEITVIWPAGAFSMWLFIRYGRLAVFPVILGQELYHIIAGLPYEPLFTWMTLNNTAAAWLGALAYFYLGGRYHNVSSLRSILSLTLVATPVQSLFSALVGCVALATVRSLDLSELQVIFGRWLFSDITGNVLFCPLLLAVSQSKISDYTATKERVLPVIVAIITLVFMWFLIRSELFQSLGQYPAILLSLPICLWLGMRRNTALATICLVIVLTGCLAMTTLLVVDFNDGVFVALQIYAAIIMGSCMVLHSMRLSRDQAIADLDMQKQHLEFAVARRTEELQKQVEATEALAAKLEHQALSDYLTDLPNRRCFTQQVNKELQRSERSGQSLAILLVDIDHFKRVNDEHGHLIGDEVLKALAIQFEELVRQGTDMVGRLGGEEFGFLLPDTDRAGALRTAERIRRSVEETPINANGIQLSMTVSVGVAISIRRRTIEQLLNEADRAMYRAKYNGRNRVEYGYNLESVEESSR